MKGLHEEGRKKERRKRMRDTYKRILVGLLAPLALLGGGTYLYMWGNPFPCVLNRVTGLYCPGCGSGRAAYDLIHLNVVGAFSHNPLFVVALPYIACYFTISYLEYVFHIRTFRLFDFGRRGVVVLLVLVVAFFIVRNVPVASFSRFRP